MTIPAQSFFVETGAGRALACMLFLHMVSIEHHRVCEIVSGAAGESGGPFLRRRENLPLSGLSAVDHPGDAELIDKHTEAVGPEGLLDWHLHNPVFRQSVKYLFRIR